MPLLNAPIESGIPLGFDWSLTSLQGSEVRMLPVRYRNYFNSAWGSAKSASRLDTKCERRAGIATIGRAPWQACGASCQQLAK